VLRRLSVFRAPFGLDAALAIATGRRGPPRGVDVVDALVESSMLVVVPAEGRSVRYRLLDTVRAFAGERLEVSGEDEDARLHHAEYHLDLVGEAGWSRLTPEFADWVPRLEAAGADVTAAVEWAWSHLPHARVGAAAPGLFEYWFRRGSPAPALDFGRRLLSGSDRLPPRLEAAGRLCAGFGAAFAGDVETATTGLDIAIDVLRDDPDWRSLVWALLGRGQNATVLGDLSTARRMGEEILRVCDEHDAPLPRAYGLALLGEAEFLGGGDLVAARAHTEAAIPGLRTLRDPAALNLFGLGIAAATCAALGDLDAAERYAVEATALPGPGWRATAFIILGGWVLHARGERDRARAAVVRGVVLAHRMSLEPWARHGLLMLARLAADEERWEEAARLFGAAHPQPPWGLDPRWWAPEQRVREALGPERHEALTSVGAATPLGEWTRRLRSAGPAGRRPAELSVEA
jgi:hypothetical protein